MLKSHRYRALVLSITLSCGGEIAIVTSDASTSESGSRDAGNDVTPIEAADLSAPCEVSVDAGEYVIRHASDPTSDRAGIGGSGRTGQTIVPAHGGVVETVDVSVTATDAGAPYPLFVGILTMKDGVPDATLAEVPIMVAAGPEGGDQLPWYSVDFRAAQIRLSAGTTYAIVLRSGPQTPFTVVNYWVFYSASPKTCDVDSMYDFFDPGWKRESDPDASVNVPFDIHIRLDGYPADAASGGD